MLTSRGWFFLVVNLLLLAVGIVDEGRQTLALLTLTLLLWFLLEWLLLALRVRIALPGLQVERQLRDERGLVETLWAGKPFQVRVAVRTSHPWAIPYLRLTDLVPFHVERLSGSSERNGVLTNSQPLTLDYRLRGPSAGQVRFEGVRIELADFQGFFYHAVFLARPRVYRVLPALADVSGQRPILKRFNLLPSPGLHRHLRPGSGSELLDLRDYLPGDPPRTIAWKLSARRDRLITKEFETEVPLRCTLFLDTSHSVRIGPPGHNALARLVEISATVAQANAGMRDLTGICLFDEDRVQISKRPARGARHLVEVLNLLADAASLAPATGAGRLETLLPLAHAFVREVYPELLAPDVNSVPSWLPWLWPLPAASGRPRAALRWTVRTFLSLAALTPLAILAVLFYVLLPALSAVLPLPPTMLMVVLVLFLAGGGVLYYALIRMLARAVPLWFSQRRRQQVRWRKQLAAVVAQHFDLGPGGVGLLLEDDTAFTLYLQRFLSEHQIPYPLPLYNRRGHYLFASPGKIEVLGRALVQAVGKGRDNELFVLLVDLLELSDQLDSLLRAVKVALARHHRVLVVCPWPPGVPAPGHTVAAGSGLNKSEPATKPMENGAAQSTDYDVQALLEGATRDRLHRAHHDLRRLFGRLGVLVVSAAEGDPVQLILDRLDRLRYQDARTRR
jgi:uncharacterized protein (DUF58 family)